MRYYLKLFITLIIFLPLFLVISTGVLIKLEQIILLLPDNLATLEIIEYLQVRVTKANNKIYLIRKTNNINISGLLDLIYKFNRKHGIISTDPNDEIVNIIFLIFLTLGIIKFFENLLSSDSLIISRLTKTFLIVTLTYIFCLFLAVYIFYGF
jgi:hypothetical protein